MASSRPARPSRVLPRRVEPLSAVHCSGLQRFVDLRDHLHPSLLCLCDPRLLVMAALFTTSATKHAAASRAREAEELLNAYLVSLPEEIQQERPWLDDVQLRRFLVSRTRLRGDRLLSRSEAPRVLGCPSWKQMPSSMRHWLVDNRRRHPIARCHGRRPLFRDFGQSCEVS